MVYIPDDSDFSSFRDQCESLEGWHCRYNKAGVTVWSQGQEESCTVQKIKVSRRFPAPAVCPAAPEGPWGLPRAGDAQSGLPGRVSAPNSRAGRVRTPEVLPSCCCPPRGFTCQARCSLRPCGLTWWCLRSDTAGKALGSVTLWRWPCREPPGTTRAHGTRPWCPFPSSATLGHIPPHPQGSLVSLPQLCHPGAYPPTSYGVPSVLSPALPPWGTSSHILTG